jgi:RimJ/RimL family protein N-acetyltransferase
MGIGSQSGASKRSPKKAPKRRSSTPKPPATSVRSGIRPPVDPESVRLERGTGSPGRGGDPGGSYWHIFVGDTRAGNVYVNLIDEAPFGHHASIQIQVNQNWQGRGVGRVAYRLASEASGYNAVYAHMRKSNHGSRAAAEHAGYTVVEHPDLRQLAMVWQRRENR